MTVPIKIVWIRAGDIKINPPRPSEMIVITDEHGKAWGHFGMRFDQDGRVTEVREVLMVGNSPLVIYPWDWC